MCGIALVAQDGSKPSESSLPPALKHSLAKRGPDHVGELTRLQGAKHVDTQQVRLDFYGAELQLRGEPPVLQPFRDADGNVLLFNGEIFGGLPVAPAQNDGQELLSELATSCCCNKQRLTPDDTAPSTDLPVDSPPALSLQTDIPSWYQADTSRSDSACQFGRRSVVEVLSSLRGPWAVIYWQASSQTLWFGRDVMGRRSLVIHWPTSEDEPLILSSVPVPLTSRSSNSTSDKQTQVLSEESNISLGGLFGLWEDVPCGIYSLQVRGVVNPLVNSRATRHFWKDPTLLSLEAWQRTQVEPTSVGPTSNPADSVLEALSESVRKRVTHIRHRPQDSGDVSKVDDVSRDIENVRGIDKQPPAQVGVLFSGGLDSMILAALADRHLAAGEPLDLINVCFDNGNSPDRLSAIAGLEELRQINPERRWRLIQVDSSLAEVDQHRMHILSLLCPSSTYMDLNIGAALWLASRGLGYLPTPSDNSRSKLPVLNGLLDLKADPSNTEQSSEDSLTRSKMKERARRKQEKLEKYRNKGSKEVTRLAPVVETITRVNEKGYKSEARVLLVGSGADEQCAGYGRHRTRFQSGGWQALDEDMRLDVQRLWQRNLGRDDRCISDWGREARFPFLDEDVMSCLLSLPLWQVADLSKPLGEGDKLVLREVARMLGIRGAATLPKRAIQFGSRIARASNRRDFGSNHAANLASAGTVKLPDL